MHILVCTHETQGTVDGDFCWPEEGEPVAMYGFVCHGWEGSCGCGRAFTSLISGQSTTTAKVIDSPLTESGLREIVEERLRTAGWLELMDSPDERDEMIVEVMTSMLEVAASFPPGAVLTRHVNGSDNDPVPPTEDYFMRAA